MANSFKSFVSSFSDSVALAGSLVLLANLAMPLSAAEARTEQGYVDIKLTPDVIPSTVPKGTLRADAQEVAQLLNIESQVNRLREAKSTGSADTKELLNMRLVCLWRIMTAAQEVRKIAGRIDRELAFTDIAYSGLCAKRDGVSNALNTMNFAQGGTLGIHKQSFVLEHWFNTSQLPLLVSASVGTSLAVVNLIHPYLWTRKSDETPNVLAHFLNDKHRPSDADVSYLWKFFTTPVPNKFENLSRREVVKKHWNAFEHVDPKEEAKLAAHPEDESKRVRESIRILGQRIRLLHDLKSHAEEIDASLFELHQAITNSS